MEYLTVTHLPGADAVQVGLPGNTSLLYGWQRVLAGGSSQFSTAIMRGPIYDKSGVEILGGTGGPVPEQSAADPTPADDSAAGYLVGDEWCNTVTGQYWKARSVAVGAAVWVMDSVSHLPSNVFVSHISTIPASTATSVVFGQYSLFGAGNNGVVAIGTSSVGAGCDRSVVVGVCATTGTDNVAIGRGNNVTGSSTVVLGADQSTVLLSRQVAIGFNSSLLADEVVTVGMADILSTTSLSLGSGNGVTAVDCVAIGNSQTLTKPKAIGIGDTISITGAGGDRSIAIGNAVTISANDCVAIGNSVTVSQADSVLIGSGNSSGSQCVCLGVDCDAGQSDTICLGANADTAVGQPLLALGFGGVDPVTSSPQLESLPTRVASTNRKLVMRDTDLVFADVVPGTVGAVNTDGIYYDGTIWRHTVEEAENRHFRLWTVPNQITATMVSSSFTHWMLFSSSVPTYTANRIRVFTVAAGATINVAIYEGPTVAVGRNRLLQATSALVGVANDYLVFSIPPFTVTQFTLYVIGFSTNGIGLAEGPQGISNLIYGGYNTTFYNTGLFPATLPTFTANNTRRQYFELLV